MLFGARQHLFDLYLRYLSQLQVLLFKKYISFSFYCHKCIIVCLSKFPSIATSWIRFNSVIWTQKNTLFKFSRFSSFCAIDAFLVNCFQISFCLITTNDNTNERVLLDVADIGQSVLRAIEYGPSPIVCRFVVVVDFLK